MKIFTSIQQFNKAYFPKSRIKERESLITKNMSQKELIEYSVNKLLKKLFKAFK